MEIQLVARVTPTGGVIDGVINEDRLGLDVIYIQAKRRTAFSVSTFAISRSLARSSS